MSGREELLTVVADIARQVLRAPDRTVTEQTRLKEDLGMDSIDMFDVLALIEKRYGICAEREDFIHVRTVADFLGVLETRYFMKSLENQIPR